MTAIRTSLQNAFETQLTAEMGPNALTAAVDSIGILTSPCYLCIDMESDSLREYIYFDGTFGASSFITTNIAKRYLPGSAAGSNLTHAIGAFVRVVPMAQHIEDLHDRIDTEIDSIVAVHAAIATAHHTKYTDAEAAAKIAADGLYVPRAEFDFVAARINEGFVEDFSTRTRTDSVELVIPGDWNTYDVEVWATLLAVAQETVTFFSMLVKLDIEGTSLSGQGRRVRMGLKSGADIPWHIISVSGWAEGLSVTGSRTVTLTMELEATSAVTTVDERSIIAHAYRTS